jgi:hypothetical protein
MSEIRQWHVQEALASYTSLQTMMSELTEQEVLRALEVEHRTRRRRSILDRLIARAVRLNEITYQQQLKEKYHAPSVVESDVRHESS